MFDTIAGLPIHALVVHGVVVLLPLMAIATLVWAFRPQAGAGSGMPSWPVTRPLPR